MWRREATSGTTPPNCACSSFCDETMDDEDLASPDDGGAGVVAGRLDGEDEAGGRSLPGGHAESPSQSFHMMAASSRSSL